MSQWVQEQQQAAPVVDSLLWSTTCQADNVLPLDDSGDSFLNSLLLSDYDFTNTIGTGLFDLSSIPTTSAPTMMGNFSGDALFDWDQANASLMSTPMVPNGSQTRTNSTPVHMISPVSSHSSMDHAGSYTLNTAQSSTGSSHSKKRSAAEFKQSAYTPLSTHQPDETDQVNKRQRNTEAARRYRQRKLDRTSELEEALAEMTRERDELKLKLARSEAEAGVLRGMVVTKS